MSAPAFLRRRSVRVAGVVLAVLLGVRALLPLAAERYLEGAVGDAVGLHAAIDDVDLGIFAGTVAVEGLTLGAAPEVEADAGATTAGASARETSADGGTGTGGEASAPGPAAAEQEGAAEAAPPLLRWKRLIVDLRWLGLAAGRIHLAAIALEAPAVHVETDEEGRLLLPGGGPAEEDALEGEAGAEPAGTGTPGESADEATPAPAGDQAPPGEAAEPAAGDAGWPLRVDRILVNDVAARVARPRAEAPAVELAFDALELASLRRDAQGISLEGISLRGPRVRADRDFLLERPADPAAEPADGGSEAPTDGGDGVRVRDLAVGSGELTLVTAAGNLETTLELTASGIDTREGARFPVTLEIRVGDGAFRVDGEAGAAPAAFTGTVAWKDLPVPPLLLAVQPALHRWVRSCSASGELEVEVSLDGAPLLAQVRGKASVRDLHFENPGGDDLSVRWQALDAELRELSLPAAGAGDGRTRIVLSRLRLVDPHLRATLPVESLSDLGGAEEGPTDEPADGAAEEPADEPAEDAEAEGGPPPYLEVESLELTEGRVLVVDRTVQPDVRATARGIEVEAGDLEPVAPAARPVEVAGKTLGGAPFSLSGRLAEEEGALRFDLERLPLAPLNPYAVDSGYRVKEGDASLETGITVEGDVWRLDNGLVLHDLRLSRVGETAVLDDVIGMPVDLALALLKDVGGDISLGIPVSFDPGGMQVSIATVLRDALRAAIAGAVTSPLKVMGAAIDFGKGVAAGDVLKVAPLAFRPGTAELAADMAEEVEALAFMLERHPALGVVLRGVADPEVDRDGLALRILAERAAADQDMPDADVEGAGFIDRIQLGSALEDHAGGEPLDLDDDELALLEAWKRAVQVPEARLDALARERAEAARRALLTGHDVDPARIRAADAAERGEAAVRITFEAVAGS